MPSNPAPVAPDDPILAEWGNDVRARVVASFPDTVARDNAFPSPDVGQVAYLESVGLTVFDGTIWARVYREADDATFGKVNATHASSGAPSVRSDGSILVRGDSTGFGDGDDGMILSYSAEVGVLFGYRYTAGGGEKPVRVGLDLGVRTASVRDINGVIRMATSSGQYGDTELRGVNGAPRLRCGTDGSLVLNSVSFADTGAAILRNFIVGTGGPVGGADGDVYLKIV